MYRIVFSDIDGTLLNEQHQMTPLTRQAILDLQPDIPFVIVSARSPSGIYPILKEYQFHCPIIAYSGALILDDKRNIIYEKAMKLNDVKAIINYIEKQNYDLSWNLYAYDQWFVKDKNDPRIIQEEQIVKASSLEIDLFTCDISCVHKILCICHPQSLEMIERDLKAQFPDCTIMKSSDHLLEIMSEGISKGNAVERMCQLWSIDLKDAIAFGDQYNDLDMLQRVGYGYAMGNAPDEIKKAVGRVTDDCNHDGIYKILRQLKIK